MGASVGVLHRGEVVCKHHFCFRDTASETPPDDNTLYGLGTATKSFVAAGVARLVADEKLKWTTTAKDIIPEFQGATDNITKMTNFVDPLAHRTSLTGAFHLTFQGDGIHLLNKKYLLSYFSKLKTVYSIREEWTYSSWGYLIIGEILERVTGETLGSYLDQAVFKHLGLSRTTTQLDVLNTSNLAKPHAALEDASSYELKSPMLFKGSIFEAAAGAYSSTTDMLKYAQSIMSAGSIPAIGEPKMYLTQQTPVSGPSLRDRSYALWWIRTQLPGVTGVMGDNMRLYSMDEMPVIGKGTASRLIMYHQGARVGFFPLAYLYPETESAFVVLTNSIALGDAADWIAQAYTQALFEDQEPIDWIKTTQDSRDRMLAKYTDFKSTLANERIPKTSHKSPESYVGNYYVDLGLFLIKISRKDSSEDILEIAFQGLKSHAYDLRHYNFDVFEWSLRRNETAKRGRYHLFNVSYLKIDFKVHIADQTDMLLLDHDPNFEKAEAFYKKD